MHICHITTIHPQQDTRIFQKQCVSLAKLGHQVTLLCAKGESHTLEGVQIISLDATNFSFKNRVQHIAPALYKKALALNADIYQFHDPDFLIPGYRLKKAGKRVIYDVHEDIPLQLLSKPYGHKWVLQLASNVFKPLENYIAKNLSAIITADKKVNERFMDLGVSPTLISNYPDLANYSAPRPFSEKKNEIFYVGDIAYIRGAVEMVKAMEFLPDTTLVLAGKIDNPELKKELMALPGWQQVRYEGYINAQRRDEILRTAKIGIVALHPVKKYMDALPTKLFEYMAAGLAVVCTDIPLWTAIIKSANCGRSIDPLNPRDIAQNIEWLLSHEAEAEQLGKNGYAYTKIHYSWETELNKLVHVYQNVIASHDK